MCVCQLARFIDKLDGKTKVVSSNILGVDEDPRFVNVTIYPWAIFEFPGGEKVILIVVFICRIYHILRLYIVKRQVGFVGSCTPNLNILFFNPGKIVCDIFFTMHDG